MKTARRERVSVAGEHQSLVGAVARGGGAVVGVHGRRLTDTMSSLLLVPRFSHCKYDISITKFSGVE
jgi:hypothetical protein